MKKSVLLIILIASIILTVGCGTATDRRPGSYYDFVDAVVGTFHEVTSENITSAYIDSDNTTSTYLTSENITNTRLISENIRTNIIFPTQIGTPTDNVSVGYFNTIFVSGGTLYIDGVPLEVSGNFTAVQGPPGEKGDTGLQGLQGIPGDKGDKGDTGGNGEPGVNGDPGANGDNGTQGIQGIQGEPGPTHSNLTILDSIQEALTTALKVAYDWLVTNITSAWKTTVDSFVSSKGAANGLAPLDANSKVPTVNLGGSGADNTKYLRGDQTWQAVTAKSLIATGKLSAPAATSGTGETLLFKLAIPANKVVVGDTFRVWVYGNSSSTGTLIFRVRVGANGTTGDNQAWISTTSAAQVANAWAGIDIVLTVRSATTVQASGHASAGAVLLPQLIGAPATAAIVSTATWYIDIDATCSSGTFTAQNAVITNE